MYWVKNRMSIQQPDRLLKTLRFKLVVDFVENSIQYWTGIFWIAVLLTIHLLLNLSCTLVRLLLVLNDLILLLPGKLGWKAHTPALLKFTTMARYFTDKQLDPTSMWNIINSIHSIRTYIITTISLFPICLLISHSSIFISSVRCLTIRISSRA